MAGIKTSSSKTKSMLPLERLVREHAKLKARVTELDSRRHLTPAEYQQSLALKKQKLAAKDAIDRIAAH